MKKNEFTFKNGDRVIFIDPYNTVIFSIIMNIWGSFYKDGEEHNLVMIPKKEGGTDSVILPTKCLMKQY